MLCEVNKKFMLIASPSGSLVPCSFRLQFIANSRGTTDKMLLGIPLEWSFLDCGNV